MTLMQWAIRHAIPYAAIHELETLLGVADPYKVTSQPGASEGAVQNLVRLEASTKGVYLWRNNVGAATLEDGSFIRWGLANDSSQVNAKLKSGDLIGIRPLAITPQMVGHTVGIFVSREIKAAGWRYSGTDREVAQLNWINLITSLGGDARFATGEGTL
ncbi:MAG: hypothetical protein ACR652_18585 [Methylocystis sp.]|uniref:hypothetical protein n=1 Tax=Methylocystis sp. TaxID=1911079 RepID=UPI003DA23001